MQLKYSFSEIPSSLRMVAIILYLLVIAAGIFVLFHPLSVVVVFLVAMIVRGLYLICKYVMAKDERNGWDLIGGIFNIAIGLIMFLGDREVQIFGIILYEILVAIWAILNGIVYICGSLGIKKLVGKIGERLGEKVGGKLWLVTLVLGVLSVACGVLMLIMPALGARVMIYAANIFMGAALILAGLLGFVIALSMGGNKPRPA